MGFEVFANNPQDGTPKRGFSAFVETQQGQTAPGEMQNKGNLPEFQPLQKEPFFKSLTEMAPEELTTKNVSPEFVKAHPDFTKYFLDPLGYVGKALYENPLTNKLNPLMKRAGEFATGGDTGEFQPIDLAAFPLSFAVPGGIQSQAGKLGNLVSQAPKVAKKLIPSILARGAGMGAGIGLGEAATKNENIPETLKTVGANTLVWSGLELGGVALGKGLSAAGKGLWERAPQGVKDAILKRFGGDEVKVAEVVDQVASQGLEPEQILMLPEPRGNFTFRDPTIGDYYGKVVPERPLALPEGSKDFTMPELGPTVPRTGTLGPLRRSTNSLQEAEQALQDGIETVQNYVGHSDVLAKYPPGTTVEEAMADIQRATGVNVEQLLNNYEAAYKQAATPIGELPKIGLEKMRLANVSGVDVPKIAKYEPPLQFKTQIPAPIEKPGPIPARPPGGEELPLQFKTQIPANREAPLLTEALKPQEPGAAAAAMQSAQPAASLSQKAISFFDSTEQAARERIAARKGRVMSGLPVDDLADYAIIGASKIAKGTVEFSVWSAEMAKEFGETVKPYLQEIYNKAKTLHGDFLDQPAAGALPDTTGQIVSKAAKPPFSLKGSATKAYIKTTDNLYRLKQLDKYAQDVAGEALSAEDKAYLLALNSRGADVVSSHILEERLVDAKGEMIGQSLKSILKKLPKGRDAVTEFEDYLLHRHAPSWMAQGRKVFPAEMGVTPEISAQKAAAYEAKHPQFKWIATELNNFQNKMGKAWLVDTGLISPETWAKYRELYPNYVPLQRQMEEIAVPQFKGPKRGFANQANPVKSATGSERPIISPIESIIEHVDMYVKTAKRNEVMQALIKNIRRDPEAFKGWAEIVKEPPGGAAAEKNFGKDILNEGVDAALEKLNTAFKTATNAKTRLNQGNVVTGIINGEKVYVKTDDPLLLDALTNLAPKGQGIVLETFRQATRMMKNLTTGINPVFSLARNIFRDIPTAFVFSKTTNNPVIFAYDLLDSFVSVLRNKELYKSFKAVGGGHSSSISADRNLLAESKARVLPGYIDPGKPVQAAARLAGKGLQTLERLNNAIETMPRLAEFKRASKPGDYSSKVEGLAAAQDVTVNFKKWGNVGKDVDAIVPYFNAAWQGLDKLAREAITDPARVGAKALFAITLPSILLYAINHKNPAYQQLNDYTKDNFMLIPKADGTFIKIPKPRELGVVFGSLPERIMRLWEDEDPKAFKRFAETVKANFIPPVRTIAAPLLDIRANKDFLDRPIVSGHLEKLSPELQYDEQTSAPAKAIGGALDVSPQNVDYLAKSYLGVIAQLGIPATAEKGGVGEMLKRQVTADPFYSNDILNDFYENLKKLDTAREDYKATKQKTASFNEPLRLLADSTARQMSEIRKMTERVSKNQKLSQEEKDKRLKVYRQKMLGLAARTNKIVEARLKK